MSEGAAEIYDGRIFHPLCVKASQMMARGFPHRCPACNGSGFEDDRDVHEVETYDPADGYNGYHSQLATRVKTRHESKRCDLCSGTGFPGKPPVHVMTDPVPARVVGWKRD